MKDRIKKLRREMDLTQQKFADKLGIKRNTIAKYETGENIPSDAVISLICREFSVNESWLRDGTGEMFVELDVEDRKIVAFTKDVLSDAQGSFRRRVICGLSTLDSDGWNNLERLLGSISVASETAP